jgi:predicted MFS family arabinose efflux permease
VRGRRLAIFGAAANVAITLTPALMSIVLATAPPATAFFVAGALAVVAGAIVSGINPPPSEESGGHLFARRALQRVGVPMLAAGLTGAGFAAFFQFAPLLAERHGGIAVGTLYGVYGSGIIAARLLTGPLIDRWRVGRTLTLSAGLMSGGLAGLAIGGPAFTLALAALLIAFGSGIAHPALLKHHAALLPHAPGQASAAFYLGFDLGIGLGSLLFGVLLELGGTGGLYAAAALLTVLVLPLARRLEQH